MEVSDETASVTMTKHMAEQVLENGTSCTGSDHRGSDCKAYLDTKDTSRSRSADPYKWRTAVIKLICYGSLAYAEFYFTDALVAGF